MQLKIKKPIKTKIILRFFKKIGPQLKIPRILKNGLLNLPKWQDKQIEDFRRILISNLLISMTGDEILILSKKKKRLSDLHGHN